MKNIAFITMFILFSMNLYAKDSELVDRFIEDYMKLTLPCHSMRYSFECKTEIEVSGNSHSTTVIKESGILDVPNHRYIIHSESPFEIQNEDRTTTDSIQVEDRLLIILKKNDRIEYVECNKDFLNSDNKRTSTEWLSNLFAFDTLSLITGIYELSGTQSILTQVIKEIGAECSHDQGKIVLKFNTKQENIVITCSEHDSNFILPENIEISKRVTVDPTYVSESSYSVVSRNSDNIPIEYIIKQKIQGGNAHGLNFEEKNVTYRIKINSISKGELFKDSEFKYQDIIVDGTQAIVRGIPQIEYIWMDGKIVPKTDERMLAIAQGGHKFMPSPKESRFWLILLGIVGILVGGGWKLYDFWTSDQEPTSPKPKDQAV